MRSSSLLTMASLCVALLFPAIASADTDSKVFPATSCRPHAETRGTIGYRHDGTVENDSETFPLTIICPIVRDSTQIVWDYTVEASVFDGSATDRVTCTAESRESFGAVVEADSQQTSTPGAGSATLTITPAAQAIDGYSFIRCELPVRGARASALVAYHVEEPQWLGGPGSTDQKSYMGAFAERRAGSLSLEPPPFVAYTELGVSTVHEFPAEHWVLPVVRDVVAQDWDRARVRSVDDSARPFVCTLRSRNEDGSVGNLGSEIEQDVGPATLVIDEALASNGDGPYAISCGLLRAEPTFMMYDVRENN